MTSLREVAAPLVTLVAVVAVWEVSVRALAVPAFLLPPPSVIFSALVADKAELMGGMLTTASGALAGLAMSLVIGSLAGLVLSLSRTLERALYPYAIFLQTVPLIAVAPLIVLWCGPGFRAVAVSAFIVSVFPIIVSTLTGMRSFDPHLADLFRLHDASLWVTVIKLRLPSAVPSMVTGWRVAAGLSVIGAIVGEFMAGYSGGHAGLGIIVLSATRQFRTDIVFAAVLLAAALGLMLFWAASLSGAVLLQRLRARG